MQSMRIVQYQGVTYAEGAGATAIQDIDDAVDVIGFCIENDARKVLLFEENLTDDFFNLRSGLAGSVLQKFRNYRIELALVLHSEAFLAGRFGEMVKEENRGSDFRVFTDADKARAWLIGENT